MGLSEILREFRRKTGQTQKEIAERLGITREHYATIEEGRRYPSHGLFEKMRSMINFEVSYTPPFPDENPTRDDEIQTPEK